MAKVMLASALFAALCVGCAAPVTDDAAQNIDPAADEASIGAASAAEEQSDSSREQQLQLEELEALAAADIAKWERERLERQRAAAEASTGTEASTPGTPLSAQWQIQEPTVDPFTDEASQIAMLPSEKNLLAVAYGCADGTETLVARFWIDADATLFAHGRVQVRFDDDPAETAVWNDFDSVLQLPVRFVQRMAQHQTLLLRVTAFGDDRVTDLFSLAGTAAMLEQINCGG